MLLHPAKCHLTSCVYSHHFNNIHVQLPFHSFLKITSQVKTNFYWLEHLHFSSTFSYVFCNYDVTSVENIHLVTFRKYTREPIKVMLKNQHVFLSVSCFLESKKAPPFNNKLHNLKVGPYQKSDHNLTITRLKCIWNKYANYEKLQKFWNINLLMPGGSKRSHILKQTCKADLKADLKQT